MSEPSTDLETRDDVLTLLDTFYHRCFADELLGPVFVDIAQMDLSVHLPIIADFWCKVALREGNYRRNALVPHQQLHEKAHLQPRHFEQWLHIWHTTIADLYAGPHADLAALQGLRIAYSMCRSVTGEPSAAIGELLEATGHRRR